MARDAQVEAVCVYEAVAVRPPSTPESVEPVSVVVRDTRKAGGPGALVAPDRALEDCAGGRAHP